MLTASIGLVASALALGSAVGGTAVPKEKELSGSITYSLGETLTYRVNVAHDNPVMLRFDFDCLAAPNVDNGIGVIFPAIPTKAGDAPPRHYALVELTNMDIREGQKLGAHIVCDHHIFLDLSFVVTTPKEATSSVRFVWPRDAKEQQLAATASARLDEQALCEIQRNKDAVAHESARLTWAMGNFLSADETLSVSNTGRSKGKRVVVYVDATRRWGKDFGVVHFRVENQSNEIVHLKEIAVEADGSEFVMTAAVASDKRGQRTEALIPKSERVVEEVTEGIAPLPYLLQATSLSPSQPVHGVVLFPFPWPLNSPGSVRLVVRGAGSDEEAKTSAIAFPAAEDING